MRQSGEKRDLLYYLTDLASLKKRNEENVVDFNKRFEKPYNEIPQNIKPSQAAAKVTFAGAFEPNFAMMLRERRSTTLLSMEDDAVDIEGSMNASQKLKFKLGIIERDKINPNDEDGPLGLNKDA